MEKCVVEELVIKGIENFYPSYDEFHQWADRKKVVTKPLFPGYVLVHCADSSQSKLRVLQTHGVVRILGFGRQIEPIPELQVVGVRQMLASGKACYPHPFFRAGVSVRIRRGPLKNLVGVLVRIKHQTRLVLSVDLIAQSVSTEVEMKDVEIIGQAPTYALAALSPINPVSPFSRM